MEAFLISDHLPTDLILEILSNLPVKSLLRFKSVCKQWSALINTNRFAMMHLDCSRRNNKEGILIKHLSGNRPDTKISFSIISNNDSSSNVDDLKVDLSLFDVFPIHHLELLAHCDGVVFNFNYDRGDCVLCNLATRETILLPKISPPNDETWIFTVGFGFDLKNYQYKAVRIAEYKHWGGIIWDPWFYNAGVYTLGADSWREAKKGNFNSMDSGKFAAVDAGFYFNGAIHWEGTYPNSTDWYSEDTVIILFNLGDEEFRRIPVPDDAKFFKSFLVWNGCLAISTVTNNSFSFETPLLKIFAMKEYGVKESWTKVLNIEIRRFRIVRPLTIWENNEILIETVEDKGKNVDVQLVSYNLRKQEFKNISQIHGHRRRPSWFKAFAYMESLVSIKSRRESSG